MSDFTRLTPVPRLASCRRRSAIRRAATVFFPPAAAALLALAACGGGGSGSVTPSGGPTPIGKATTAPPTPTPGPTAVGVTPESLAFTAAGAGVPGQSVAVSQAKNTGGFTLTTTTCANIASVTPAAGAGPFTFAPLAAGTCTYLVSGSGGASAKVTITVTTTGVVSQ
jgi:hypothetical protein